MPVASTQSSGLDMKVIYIPLLLCCLLPIAAFGEDKKSLQSGPQAGEILLPFKVEKCAGNEADKVKLGQKLCYRCMLGNRPVVAVFARTPDKRLAKLLHELDAMIEKHQRRKLASFVSLLGKDKKQLRKAAKELVETAKLKHIAVVVPDEHAQGPSQYKIHPRADLTVLAYKEGRVQANITLGKNKLDEKSSKAITTAATNLVKAASD